MANLTDAAVLTTDQIEEVEKASARLVFQAVKDFVLEAIYIFDKSPDDQTEVAEDTTRELMNKLPGYPLPERIFGVMDYKRAGYVFLSELSTRQALLIDSKAEKTGNVARLQVSQTSLPIRQVRGGQNMEVLGALSTEMVLRNENYLVTTIFIHYRYEDKVVGRKLKEIKIASLPSGKLSGIYVPSFTDTIFVAGPNSPLRGEDFRTRLSFSRLQRKCRWRVQSLQMVYPTEGPPSAIGEWTE
jgi:hypothetical protein